MRRRDVAGSRRADARPLLGGRVGRSGRDDRRRGSLSNGSPAGPRAGSGADPGHHRYIDRIDRLASGGVELVDYKTGRAGSTQEAESSLQLSIYALGCRDGLGLGRPERVTLDFVEHGLRCRADRTDAELDRVRARLAARAREIHDSGFSPTPSRRACGWCDFAAICPVSVQES